MPLNPFEESCLEQCRSGYHPKSLESNNRRGLIEFGFWLLFNFGSLIRSHRIFPSKASGTIKKDKTPVTELEHRIEEFVKDNLHLLPQGTAFIGEESGGELPETGLALALDPIDGTWSFLSHSETCSTSLAFFENGKAIVGMIMNPATGEVGYTDENGRTRLVQLSIFDEKDDAIYLPTYVESRVPTCLVNLHPARTGSDLVDLLYSLWNESRIQMVRSTGGSPSWAMFESAKGHVLYINLWEKKPADPFDLASSVLLVEGAGGKVVGLDGKSIEPNGHRGVFFAGTRLENYEDMMNEIRDKL